MAFGVVIRHYKRVGFYVKNIECDGEFKSIMDEVRDEMGIEMNDANPYDHVLDTESNNRVIKERF